jgi:hypothetical protein
MANGDDTLIHLIHTLWSAVLSAFGGLIVWNWNKLSKEVDTKADKTDVGQLRSDLVERWRQQDALQAEIRQRLDRIVDGIAKLNGPR